MHLDRLSVPLHDLSAWTARFRALEIPVLARTAAELEELHRNEDTVDANLIGETVSRGRVRSDPPRHLLRELDE